MLKGEELSKQAIKIMLSFVVDKKQADVDDLKEKFEDLGKTNKYVENDSKAREPTRNVQASDSYINKRVLNLEDPTLIVKIGTFAFQVNMEIFELYSEYAKKHNEFKDISLPESEVSPIAFVAIYEWMVSENPGLPRKGIVELYKAASYLGIQQLLAQIWACISNPLINEDRAYLLYLEALAFEVPEIRKTMLNRISRFFLHIVSCEEFLHIPYQDLCTLLKSNWISVNSELEIYFSCVRYFNFNWEERRHNLLPVMKLIRYDFLPTNFVLELLNQETNFVIKEVTRIVDHPELQDILRDLMHYHCLVAFPGPNSVSIEKSMQRNWIFDPQCNYHNRANPRKMNPEYMPFMEFVTYLGILNIAGAKHWESYEPIKIEKQATSFENIVEWEVFK